MSDLLHLANTLRLKHAAAAIHVEIDMGKGLTKQLRNKIVKALKDGVYQASYGPGATIYEHLVGIAGVPGMTLRKGKGSYYYGHKWRLHGWGVPFDVREKLNLLLQADFTAAQFDDSVKSKPKSAEHVSQSNFHTGLHTVHSVERLVECLDYTQTQEYQDKIRYLIARVKDGDVLKARIQ